jgi:ribonuclease HI
LARSARPSAGARGLTIHGDSRVVIDDMNGQVPSPGLAPLRLQAAALLAQVDGASLRWIPRHRNGAADALSQRASHGPLPVQAGEKQATGK